MKQSQGHMRARGSDQLAAVAAVAVTSSIACAQTNYGIDFVTVGAAGNRATTTQEASDWDFRGGVGAVSVEFGIARTELTVGQYLEFVNAYAPYWSGNPSASALTGFWIVNSGNGVYRIRDGGSANFAADMTWRMAARYCNWLCNGKATNREAFERGAYDTSTFTSQNADHTWNDQTAHSPGARFWIPTLDEWVKAVYYDPNRYGLGEGGYWTQPNGSDTPLVSGLPQDGGQTSAGLSGNPLDWLPIASYPDVQSPWGLLDASGGLRESTEAWNGQTDSRITKGSAQGTSGYFLVDDINGYGFQNPTLSGLAGLRIATVPAPAASLMSLVLAGRSLRRRRNR